MAEQKVTYILRTELAAQGMKYYAFFTDGQAVFHDVEISHEVFQELQHFIKQERNLKRGGERHIEQSQLSEVTLHKRAIRPPPGRRGGHRIGNTAKDRNQTGNRKFTRATAVLFFYCHYKGLTEAQIAKLEGCRQSAVAQSLKAARKTF